LNSNSIVPYRNSTHLGYNSPRNHMMRWMYNMQSNRLGLESRGKLDFRNHRKQRLRILLGIYPLNNNH